MKTLKEIVDLLENAKEIITVEAGVGMIVGDSGLCDFIVSMEEAEKDINKAFFFLHSFTDEAMTEKDKDEKISVVLYACNKLFEISRELKRSPFNFRSVMTSLNGVIIDLRNLRMGVL